MLKYDKKYFIWVRAARVKLITPDVICFEQRQAKNSNGSKGIGLSFTCLLLIPVPFLLSLRSAAEKAGWLRYAASKQPERYIGNRSLGRVWLDKEQLRGQLGKEAVSELN